MAYIVRIPKEDRAKVAKILKENREKKEIKYLVKLYYRYCKVVDNYEKEVDIALSCSNCMLRVLSYFKRNNSKLC